MANYQETLEYFENIATINALIQHSPTSQKFFRMSIEEFISGSNVVLPQDVPAMVLINYINDYSDKNHFQLETQQIMFYILKSAKINDFDQETAARIETEKIVKQILLRMKNDSNEDHPFFLHAFDTIINTRIIPMEMRMPSGKFVGWQCSLYLNRNYNECYHATDWL